jgi:hypothetical protein
MIGRISLGFLRTSPHTNSIHHSLVLRGVRLGKDLVDLVILDPMVIVPEVFGGVWWIGNSCSCERLTATVFCGPLCR